MSAQELIDALQKQIDKGNIKKDEPIYFGHPEKPVDWICFQDGKHSLQDDWY